VIGSQSRREPSRIKHNRYAFVEPTLCTTWISCFLHCDESGTGRNDDQLIVGR
jgi:hypothetical protein